jgi:hypothetical protein
LPTTILECIWMVIFKIQEILRMHGIQMLEFEFPSFQNFLFG